MKKIILFCSVFLVHTLYGPGCHSGCTTDDAPSPVPKLPFLQSASQDIDQVLEEMHDEARKKNNEEKSMSENVGLQEEIE
jgi:hypothetical protein